ncbi:MAG: DUF998 domain-containing protein [Candidatus Omnitrophota bacterium]
MSELQTAKNPIAFLISAWWIIYGILIIVFGIGFGKTLNLKKTLTKLSMALIILFGIGAGIGSGIFPYSPTTQDATISGRIHDISGSIGFIAILFLPIISLKLFLSKKN